MYDPWTIDPANPGAPATRSGRDRLNNMEQVSVENPTPGAWRVQVVGHSVPVGPQAYALSSTPNPIACSSTGVVGFAGQRVQPETIVDISAVDCDLNTDDEITDTVAVKIWSDDNPTGFDTVLTEDDPNQDEISESVREMVCEVQKYVPGYRLKNGPVFDGRRISTYLEVAGLGDFLPKFAGNLDIMTAAALRTGELFAEEIQSGRLVLSGSEA